MTRYHKINNDERRPYTAEEEAAADAADAFHASEAEVNKRHNADVDLNRIDGYATDGDNFDALWKAVDALIQGQEVPTEVTDFITSRSANKAANPKR